VTSESGAAGGAADGLNEDVWQIVTGMAIAASAGDVTTYRALGRRLEGQVPTAVGYLDFLLGQTIVARLQVRKPSDEQLAALVEEASLGLALMGRFTRDDAMLTLREMFGSTPIPEAPKGIFFVMYASVLLGSLTRDPATELPRLRSWLRRKCAELVDREPGRFEYLRPSQP
jgi:hypothetical protein